jgi:hypothetical protein
MVVPPTFADLGKAAKDVFKKGFSVGSTKLDVKTKTGNGIALNPVFEMKDDGIVSSFETSGKVTDGVTLKEKWSSDNVVKTNIVVEDIIAKGLKCDLEVVVNPASGKKSAVVKSAYKRDYFNGTMDCNLDLAGPTFLATAVTAYSGFQGGLELAFNTEKSTLTKNTVAAGFSNADFAAVAFVRDASVFDTFVHHKVCDKTEIAANINWNMQSNAANFGVGLKHKLDDETSLNAKLDGAGKSTLGITHKVKPYLSVTMSSHFDVKSMSGIQNGISFEAAL